MPCLNIMPGGYLSAKLPKHTLFVIRSFCIVFDNMHSMTKMPSALALLVEPDRIDVFDTCLLRCFFYEV